MLVPVGPEKNHDLQNTNKILLGKRLSDNDFLNIYLEKREWVRKRERKSEKDREIELTDFRVENHKSCFDF